MTDRDFNEVLRKRALQIVQKMEAQLRSDVVPAPHVTADMLQKAVILADGLVHLANAARSKA